MSYHFDHYTLCNCDQATTLRDALEDVGRALDAGDVAAALKIVNDVACALNDAEDALEDYRWRA